MKFLLFLVFSTLTVSLTYSQTVEIQGHAKITEMNNDNSIEELVVRNPDGTLGTRAASSLPVNNPDTIRNLSTDFELAQHMCDCGANLPPFMIESLLANGYTKEDLLRAGVPFSSLEDQEVIMDGDGNEYEYITIGNQRWLSTNLKTTSYSDGSAIPNYTIDADWLNAGSNSEPAYCWHNNDINNKEPYGALYNWFALDSMSNGFKNVCPNGWGIPSYQDLEDLRITLDPYGSNASNNVANKIKESGGDHWNTPNPATNSSQFTAVGASTRLTSGAFTGLTYLSQIHSKDYVTGNPSQCLGLKMFYQSAILIVGSQVKKDNGQSIRCMQVIE